MDPLEHNSPLDVSAATNRTSLSWFRFSNPELRRAFRSGVLVGAGVLATLGGAFLAGRWSAKSPTEASAGSMGVPFSGTRTAASEISADRIHPDFKAEWLRATATHGGSNLAVCTASAGEEAEGFFALDFLTGDLKGWVYYPRMGGFGGLFATNVIQYLGPPGKNPEYLLVSGSTHSAPSGGNMRAANSLLYVVDAKLGTFVAFTIPWNRSMESSGVQQMNTLLPVGGDIIRPMVGPGQRKAPAVDPNQKANQDPNNQNNANPNNANPNGNANNGNANRVNQNQANPNNAVPNNANPNNANQNPQNNNLNRRQP